MSGGTASPAGSRALETVSTACRTVAILLLALMSTLVVAQVVGRNLFDLGMPWADELTRFCGVALVFLGVPLLAFRGQHVAVNMAPMMLPPAGRRAAALIVEFMVLVFCAFALWGLQTFLARAGKFATPAIGIPNWVYYAPAVIAFFLLALVTIMRFVTLIRGGELSREETPVQ